MRRRLLLVAVAMVLAVFGTAAVFAYVSKADSRALADEQPVTVLLVKKDVAAGTKASDALADGAIGPVEVARKTRPAGALSTLDGIDDQVARTDLVGGQVVFATLFGAQAATKTGLGLKAGQMAVTVKVDDPQRVGGFVKPGSEVAVFDTFNSYTFDKKPWTPSGDGLTEKFVYNRATRLLLPRVTVLAIGPTTGGDGGGGDEDDTSTASAVAGANTDPKALVTVAVDQVQAEKLIQGAQTGHLYVALLDDRSKTAPSDGIDNRNLFDDGRP